MGLIDRLPKFLREELERMGVDASDDEQVRWVAGLLLAGMVHDACESNPDMPEGLRTAFVTREEVCWLEIWKDGWPYAATFWLTELEPEAMVRGEILQAIRAIQKKAAEAGL
jgi:hypothetical protein